MRNNYVLRKSETKWRLRLSPDSHRGRLQFAQDKLGATRNSSAAISRITIASLGMLTPWFSRNFSTVLSVIQIAPQADFASALNNATSDTALCGLISGSAELDDPSLFPA